jgi:anti-anti-sigma factor
MKLPTEIFGNVVVVHTPEELGDERTDGLETLLTSLERTCVVVELDGTESINSAALAALLNAQDALRHVRGDLKISTKNVVNRKILEITRLDQHLEVYESVLEAVKSFV